MDPAGEGGGTTYLHHGEGTWKVQIRKFDLCTVHPSKNLGRADSPCDPGKASVDQAHDAVV